RRTPNVGDRPSHEVACCSRDDLARRMDGKARGARVTSMNVDNAEHRAIAEPNTVLLGLVGSTVHGVTVDRADDRDEMGICIEPPEYVAGLRPFSQWVFRTQPEGARSGPGDIDRTVYSLRKWCRLALSGNPTVMLLLHTPEEHCSILEQPGRDLRAN